MLTTAIAVWAQPTITSSTPTNGATDVNETDNIVINLSESIRDLDNSGLGNTSIDGKITLKINDALGANIGFNASINAGDDQITIDPNSSLPSGTVIYVALADVENNSNAVINPNPSTFTFTVRDYVTPTATFSPADGATGIAVNSNITITLDEPVFNTDASNIDDSNVSALIELRETDGSGSVVPATVTFNEPTNTIITIDPNADLNSNMSYFVRLLAVEDAAGNETTPVSITFSTPDTQAPILTFTPTDAATDVSVSTTITIDFDEAVRRIDNSTISNANVAALITLKQTDASGPNITFTATINAGKDQITITPSSNLPDLTPIYVSLAPVEDNSNNATSASAITFTTTDGTAPLITFSPIDGELDVAVNSNITISFNEAIRNIDNSAISDANVASLITFKLTDAAGANVAFTATIVGNIITINPDADLDPNQDYFVRINPVEDSFNNATSTTSITFTSEDTLPPVATFNPTNGASNVNNSNNIIITFNEPIRNLDNSVLDNTTIDGKITLKLTDALGANIPFNATINGGLTQVTIDPTSALPDLSTIYVSIANVEDNFDNAITPQSITFTTTDGTPPVISFNPTNGSNDVTISADLTITFNEPIRRLDNTTFDDTNIDALITLKVGNAGGANFAFNATIDVTKTIVTINPNSNFATNQQYYLAIGSVEDLYNNAASSANITFITADLTVVAGADRTICTAESTTLGGSPTISGGNGFYNISWVSNPVGFTSNQSNPTVSPSVTTTYTCTVTDSDGNTNNSSVVVTVNAKEPAANLAIQVNPVKANNTYSTEDDPVQLTYTLNGSPGIFSGNTTFIGPGVNSQGFFKYFYPEAANIGENQVTLQYENAQQCITEKTITLRVVTPNGIIGGIDALYCDIIQNDALIINEPQSIPNGTTTFYGYRYVYKNSVQLYHYEYPSPDVLIPSALNTGYYVAGKNITINPGKLSLQAGTGYYYFTPVYDIEYLQWNPLTMTNDVYYSYTNYSFFRVYLNIAPKPDLDIQVSTAYCENDPLTRLTALPKGGTFKVNNSSTGLSTDVFGDTYFDPGNNLLPDNIYISYEYTNPQGCYKKDTVEAVIYRLPPIDFTFTNGCEGDDIVFTPQLAPADNNINEYFWSFGVDNITSDVLSGAALTPISFRYDNPDNYQVRLFYNTNTAKVCSSSVTKPLVIGEIPNVNFDWRNVCLGSPTTFTGMATGLGSSAIQSIEWDFDGNGYVLGAPSTINNSFSYATAGSRTVKFKVNTNKNCSNEILKTVYSVPTVGTNNIPYEEFFDNTSGGWVTGISNLTPSSWNWETPVGYKLNGDASGAGKAWFTGSAVEPNMHYNLNEKSWVHSPCLDLSLIERPVLSLDIRSLMQNGLDGVVIQIDSTNRTDSENTWKTVGAVATTSNWYNDSGIPGNPGLQLLNQFGWSEERDTTLWRTALIPLDTYLPKIKANRNKVRFRIALGSQTSNIGKEIDGFAFDNFTIKERNRVVLLELFTNSAEITTNTTINTFALQPATFEPKNEIIKLEYHLGIPDEDELYNANKTDPSGRATYYGVTAPPAIRIDGSFESGSFAQWGTKTFSQRTLKSSQVTIDTIFIVQEGDAIKVHTEFTVVEELAPNTIVHIALVEKEIISGGNTYRYVVRKMLPDATGVKFGSILPASITPVVLEEYFTPTASFINDPSELAIIVFLQNEDTKEVYQARIRSDLNFTPTLVTEAESSFENQLSIYPNPAKELLNIKLPQQTKVSLPVQLIDSYGKAVITDTFQIGEQTKSISTSELANGFYLLRIQNEKGEVAMKKIIIMHSH